MTLLTTNHLVPAATLCLAASLLTLSACDTPQHPTAQAASAVTEWAAQPNWIVGEPPAGTLPPPGPAGHLSESPHRQMIAAGGSYSVRALQLLQAEHTPGERNARLAALFAQAGEEQAAAAWFARTMISLHVLGAFTTLPEADARHLDAAPYFAYLVETGNVNANLLLAALERLAPSQSAAETQQAAARIADAASAYLARECARCTAESFRHEMSGRQGEIARALETLNTLRQAPAR